MRCYACRTENPLGARFCATCGARMGASPGPSPATFETICVNCGERTHALPYFSRAWNVGKGILLLPLTVVGPLLFFLLRRDRVICAHCRKLMPGEAHVPLLSAFNPQPVPPPALPMPMGHGAQTTLVPATRALLRKSRTARFQAWFSGLVSTVFVGSGLSEINHGIDDVAPFGVFAMFFAGVSFYAFRKSERTRNKAAEVESRERTLRLLDLARHHGGRLTAALVATELRLDLTEAERSLDSIVDGRNVDMQIADDGQVSYQFRGLPAKSD